MRKRRQCQGWQGTREEQQEQQMPYVEREEACLMAVHQGSAASSTMPSPAHLTLWRFQFVSWDNIDEKVKLIKFCYCHGDIIPL